MTAKILLVDDVPANLNALSDMLEPEGYHILAARSGEQALDTATRNQPDLILLDVMMPGLSGYETCHRLKENEATRAIPVIFLTVQDEIERVVEGFRAGGVDYVRKPFQADELLIRIQTHLKVHFLSQELQRKNEQLQTRSISAAGLKTRLPNWPSARRSVGGSMGILARAKAFGASGSTSARCRCLPRSTC